MLLFLGTFHLCMQIYLVHRRRPPMVVGLSLFPMRARIVVT
jgi:hypothetical protein